MTEQIKVKIGLDGVPETQAGALKVAGALERMGQAANLSSKQTAQLGGQLSAQVQDFIVQIQSGQSPITAFLQQGSQVSAQMGGLGNAFRAVGALLTPTVLGFGAAAAAIGTIGLAYSAGAAQSKEFANALSLTGNAAGATEARFNALADSIGKRTLAGVGTAREALQTLIASGKLSGTALEATAGAAAALSRATGEAVGDVAKRFAGFTDNVAESARKLNEQYNFLSVAQYAQIKALEESGNKNAAVELTMRELEARANSTTANLGTLERAWGTLTRAVAGYGEALKKIGRTPTTEDQIGDLRAQIAQREAARATDRGGKRQTTYDAEIAALNTQLEQLSKASFKEQERAAAAAAYAAQQRAGIKWIDEGNKYLDKQAQKEREIKALRVEAREAGRLDDDPELAKRIAFVNEKYAEKAKAQKDSANAYRAEQDAAKEWARTLENAAKLQADAEASTLGLSKAQAALVQYLSSPAYGINSEEMRQMAVSALIAAHASEQLAADQKAAAQAAAEGAKLYARQVAELDRAADAAQHEVERARDEAQATALATASKISLAEAIAIVTVERLKEKQVEALGNEAAVLAIQREIDARQQLISLIHSKDQVAATKKAADEEAKIWERNFERIENGLADALIAGGRSARDYLVNLFRSLVLAPIVRPLVAPIAGLLASAGAEAGTGGTGTGTIGALGYVNAATAIEKMYTFYTGSGANTLAGNYAALYSQAATSTIGQSLGLSSTAITTGNNLSAYSASTSLTPAGSAVGTAGSVLGAAAIGQVIGRGLSGGYSAFGGASGSSAVNAGTVIGGVVGSIFPVIGTALGAAVGAALGGVVNRLFGTKLDSSGISGSFTDGKFTGQAYQDYKGGVFRADSTKYATLDADVQKALDEGGAALVKGTTKYVEALGLPAEQMDAVTAQFKVKLTDDAQANATAITEALTIYSDTLLGAYKDQLEPLRLANETFTDEIARIGGALTGVNDVLGQLGVKKLDSTLTGGQAALNLTSQFGGADNFQGAASAFYQAFYSEADKTSALTTQLSDGFKTLGLTMPDVTRGVDAAHAAYVALVQQQDANTEAGRNSLAALIALAPAFDAVAQASDKAAATAKQQAADLQSAIGSALPKFQTPAQQSQYGYVQTVAKLSTVGVNVSVGQLLGASKEDILAFATAFVGLANVSTEAKIAVVNAAGALADLKDGAADLANQRVDLQIELLRAQGHEQAALNLERQREIDTLRQLDPALASMRQSINDAIDAAAFTGKVQGIFSAQDSSAADFLPKPQLIQYRADRVQAILAEGGIDTTIAGLLGSTKADVLALWNAVGVDGKQAILNALPLWQQLEESINGTARAVQAYSKGSLTDSIESARLGSLAPKDRITALKATETTLFGQLSTSDDPVATAQRLSAVITERLNLEAGLRSKIDAQQLDTLKRMKSLSEEVGQFLKTIAFSDLSPLDPRAQLNAAQSLFTATLRGAQSGNTTAQGALTGNAQALLQEAASAYGSGPGYTAIYNAVKGALQPFEDAGAHLDPQITALETIDESLGTSGALYTALMAIQRALTGQAPIGSGSADASSITLPLGDAAAPGTLPSDLTTVLATPLPVIASESAAQTVLQQKQLDRLDTLLTKLTALVDAADANASIDQAGFVKTVAGLGEVKGALEDIETRMRINSNAALAGS